MGLTMHSPGGVPGISPAYMWPDNISGEREWADSTDPFYLGYLAAGALSVSALGALYRVGAIGGLARFALVQGTRARTWAAYNVYKEYGDLKHWARGGKFQFGLSLKARPITTMYFPYPIAVPFPWVSLNPVEGSSSQTYQQNGGPSALHQRGRPVPVVKPAAKPSAHGGGGSGAKPRYSEHWFPRCPKGHYWDYRKRKCVPKKKY